MRITIYIGSHAASIESAHDYNFALTGCLDESKERPAPEVLKLVADYERTRQTAKPGEPPTKDQTDAVNRWIGNRARGRYARKIIDWFLTEEEAEAAKARWTEHTDFRIQPVEAKIP